MARGGYRILTGAVVPAVDGSTLEPGGWRAYLTVAPYGEIDKQREGEGGGNTPRAALDRAMADLAKQGAFKNEGGA